MLPTQSPSVDVSIPREDAVRIRHWFHHSAGVTGERAIMYQRLVIVSGIITSHTILPAPAQYVRCRCVFYSILAFVKKSEVDWLVQLIVSREAKPRLIWERCGRLAMY
jgi:hypothetical protein